MSRGWDTQTKRRKARTANKHNKNHTKQPKQQQKPGKVDGWSVCNVSKGCKRLLGLLQPSSHETQRNKKLTSSGFKYQPICALLALTRNKIISKQLQRTQFWVWKTFSKPASLKRASLVLELRLSPSAFQSQKLFWDQREESNAIHVAASWLPRSIGYMAEP